MRFLPRKSHQRAVEPNAGFANPRIPGGNSEFSHAKSAKGIGSANCVHASWNLRMNNAISSTMGDETTAFYGTDPRCPSPGISPRGRDTTRKTSSSESQQTPVGEGARRATSPRSRSLAKNSRRIRSPASNRLSESRDRDRCRWF
jgi:hypothetical protein